MPEHSTPPAVQVEPSPDAPLNTIALCLSGGGLRATLFHFGVIKALRTHEKAQRTALSAVREIYSVSGGSITAAHLVRFWAQYNGPQFAALQDQIIKFARRNIRDRIVRRWLLARGLIKLLSVVPKPDWFTQWLKEHDASRGFWLQREYRKLLGAGSIADCFAGDETGLAFGTDSPPHLHILATSFTSGDLCSFSETQFEVEPNPIARRSVVGSIAPSAGPNAPAQEPHRAHGGHVPLALAVAASSAFPPLFPPVRLTSAKLRHPKDTFFNDGILLSDGGVFDNLGYEKFALNNARASVKVGTLIVSNAGGSFRTSSEESYSDIISRNVRASDILMRRIGVTTNLAAAGLAGSETGPTFLDVQIGDSFADRIIQPATQESLRLVRTDLDKFDNDLAYMLIDHGYRVTAQALQAAGWGAVGSPEWCITQGDDEELGMVAEKAVKRSLVRPLFFGISDWKAFLAIWMVIALAIAGIVWGIERQINLNQAENDAKNAKMRADQAAADAKDAELIRQKSVARQASGQLESVRQALEAGNLPEARRRLAIAVVQSDNLEASSSIVSQLPPVSLDAKQVDDLIEQNPSYTITPATLQRDQKVYIQFAGILTRAQITALNRGLRDAGWNAQGGSGERTTKAAGFNQVRYAKGDEAAAKELAEALSKSGIVAGSPIKLQRLDAVGPNLEVWISK
ncbi:patatin-like phospholipase family protein [Novosphingobium sp. KACC 22771]|uniref:patatin-like phospholipase family protein n=1 Tax=Novosphingobium sp. KACC 22771 TaxID=3025670 RepID=UPI0023651319|nr:patatin-like phospholipase family protein [Novosphingobium sp. KACC 22771]WDF72307.1 patatin-like phospholipase family protein [Novosphingobium sp. KACC 22771]